MSRQDAVSEQLSVVQSAQVEAVKAGLYACYDKGAEEAGSGGASDEQVKAAVDAALAVAAEQAAADKAQALVDQKAQFDADFAVDEAADDAALAQAHADAQALGDSLHEEIAKLEVGKQAAESVVLNLKQSAAKLKAVLDALNAVVDPSPVPEPAPEVPVEPASPVEEAPSA